MLTVKRSCIPGFGALVRLVEQGTLRRVEGDGSMTEVWGDGVQNVLLECGNDGILGFGHLGCHCAELSSGESRVIEVRWADLDRWEWYSIHRPFI